MRLVFFGTSPFANTVLEHLLTDSRFTVNAVVTSPDKPVGRKQIMTASSVSDTATKHQIETHKPAKVRNNPELWDVLKKYQADVFVVVAYGKILPLEVLDIPPLGSINVHGSILPLLRGAAPIQFALWQGFTKTGVTITKMDEQLDHGPILATQTLAIDPADTFKTLAGKLADISGPLLAESLLAYQAGTLPLVEQNHDAATFARIITKEDGKINWQQTATEIYNQFRALTPWPGVWTESSEGVIKILSCEPGPATEATPGTWLADGAIACGHNTSLVIHTLQLAGKQPTSSRDFLRGRPHIIGTTIHPDAEQM
jgi:methionyl-tRNA formyltransferase